MDSLAYLRTNSYCHPSEASSASGLRSSALRSSPVASLRRKTALDMTPSGPSFFGSACLLTRLRSSLGLLEQTDCLHRLCRRKPLILQRTEYLAPGIVLADQHFFRSTEDTEFIEVCVCFEYEVRYQK